MTKKENFTVLKGIVDVFEVNEDFTEDLRTELLGFIDHELELLNKKSTSPRKPTKTQLENATFKEDIYNALVEAEKGVTMKELFEICEPIQGLATQRVTHILTSLIKEGRVERDIVKKVRYYKAVV